MQRCHTLCGDAIFLSIFFDLLVGHQVVVSRPVGILAGSSMQVLQCHTNESVSFENVDVLNAFHTCKRMSDQARDFASERKSRREDHAGANRDLLARFSDDAPMQIPPRALGAFERISSA